MSRFTHLEHPPWALCLKSSERHFFLCLRPHSGFACVCAKSLQSCLSLWDPMDCNPPGSSVYGILQARILEWIAMPSFRGSSWLRYQTRVSSVSCLSRQFLYQFCHLGSLTFFLHYILSICTARLFDSSIYLFIYQFLKVSCVGRMGRVKSHFTRENFYTQRLF